MAALIEALDDVRFTIECKLVGFFMKISKTRWFMHAPYPKICSLMPPHRL
jgi:hypothetical protein